MATRKTTTRKKTKPRRAYRLLVKLEGSEPLVWRLVSVPGNMTNMTLVMAGTTT